MLKVDVGNPKALEAAIRSVSKFAGGSSGYGATQWIHVKTLDTGLRLTATDLYSSVEYAVNSSHVHSEGELCIESKNLLNFGTLVKHQSGVSLEETETGLKVALADAPTFGARFDTQPTDEFPALPSPSEDAHTLTLTADQVALVKSLSKYACKDAYRTGLNAVQFATQDNQLYAYATDGKTIAYVNLFRVQADSNFAIPVDTVKRALQVTSTPELKGSDWTLTLPESAEVSDSTKGEVVTIGIQDTAVKSRSDEPVNLIDYIREHRNHYNAADDLVNFDTKALRAGFKKVSKVFVKDKRVENILSIESRDGTVTMTSKPISKPNYSVGGVDMQSRYEHVFDTEQARCVTGDFRVSVDAKDFENYLKDLSATKPNNIAMDVKYGIPDSHGKPVNEAVVLSAEATALVFITIPKKL